MKVRFTDIVVGSCFVGKNGRTRKKISERQAASRRNSDGLVDKRKVKGNPEVEQLPACPLELLGVGLRRHPERVIEIGDGNILERRKKGR